MKITIDDVMAFGLCRNWTKERILDVSGGRSEVETSDLPDLDISAQNLVWLTYHILQARGNRDGYMLKATIAERVLPIFERQYPGDMRPRDAIKAARLYAMHEVATDVALTAALDAAKAADVADAATHAAYAADAAVYAVVPSYTVASYVADAASYAAEVASYAVDAATYAAFYTADAAIAAEAAAAARNKEIAAQREICRVFLEAL